LEFLQGSLKMEATAASAAVWQSVSAPMHVMADESGAQPIPAGKPSSTARTPSLSGTSDSRMNVLLAEDNLPDSLLIREAIRRESLPIELHVVTDGEQAIAFINRAAADPAAPSPHAIVLDLNLPKIDGFGVLHEVRGIERFKNIPVLVVTSSDSPNDRKEAATLGAEYFRKPVSYHEFMKIGEHLRQFLLKHQTL